jgi:oxygen-independent coproporphyrinogen-3 oxidase
LKTMKHGIYIHIPFCRKKCDYCNFYSVPVGPFGSSGVVPDAYIRKLSDEISDRLPGLNISAADTVYFGGGTPSLLTPDQVGGILGLLRGRVKLDHGAEITLEMNPGNLSTEKLSGFRDAGVNRVVLGVQTLSERLHRMIGRSAAQCTMRDLDVFFGVSSLIHCVDLIAGIPSERSEELLYDIDVVAGYGPRHISAYLLSVEKNTPLAGRMVPDAAAESEQALQFELTVEQLKKHGYDHYEISNHALPGFESRHNMKYWRFEPYAGFGPGAHTFVQGERFINAMTVEEYLASERAFLTRDVRTPRSAMVEYILTGLRLMRGMSIDEMEKRLAYDLPDSVLERIKKAESDGLIIMYEEEGRLMSLSERGIMIADKVIFGIVEPLL